MIYFIGNKDLIESKYYHSSTLNNCMDWLESLWCVNLDTETEGLFNHSNNIIMLQLNYKDTTYIIDTRCVDIKPLKYYLEKTLIVGHNLKFDYKFLKKLGIELFTIYDTFLAECCLTNGLQNRSLDLASVANKYSTYKLDKSVRSQFIGLNGQPFTDKQIIYGANDVRCLTDIRKAQLKELDRLGLRKWVDNEFEACLALADIEYNGMGFNQPKWLELARRASLNVLEYTNELDTLVRKERRLSRFIKKQVQGNLFYGIEDGEDAHERDVDIKWSSPKQIGAVLKELGLDLPEGTGERFLTKYQKDYPIIKKFIDYKKQAKLVTTYGVEFLKYVNPVTQRIHTSFWQIVDTTRVSSGDKYSPNMQNLPANNDYRTCFKPRDGFKMVSCDFSGQELRLTAEMSQEPLWIDAFNRGEDLHSKVAAMVFKIPIENVKNKPQFLRGKSYRDAAKTINFGLIYGMSKYKLADTLDISVDDADKIIKDYFKATPKLNNYLRLCRAYGIENGYIRCAQPYSIIRYFPQWDKNVDFDFKIKGSIERASMNTPIQGELLPWINPFNCWKPEMVISNQLL